MLVGCAGPNFNLDFRAEAGVTYMIQVGVIQRAEGNVRLGLSKLVAVSGRIVDDATGAPLPGNQWPYSWAALYRVCGAGCLEQVARTNADTEGRFWLGSSFVTLPGTYLLRFTANLYPVGEYGPFELTGEDLDVGELNLSPLPTIGAIRGRIVDKVTGKPVSPDFFPALYLYRCTEVGCSEFVNWQATDRNSRFQFETDSYGHTLPAGIYQLLPHAYYYHDSEPYMVEVKEGQSKTVKDLRLRSFPVRLSDLHGCESIPASGGECTHSVRVWNGLGGRFEGDIWSMANPSLANSLTGDSYFEVKEKELVLERGKSRVVRFRLKIPAMSQELNPYICLTIFVGRGGNSSFNTMVNGSLCMERTANGLAVAAQPENRIAGGGLAITVPTATEVEPNNSCQTPQDVDQVPLPFSLDGNLDSSQTPDIDYYRFQEEAGQVVVIDYEGQATGKGSLADPLLGVFDSGCNLIAINDDSGSRNSRAVIQVPADGIFIVAATAYPDWGFAGGGDGTYQLTTAYFEENVSITGRVTNAASGEPIPPEAFGHVVLMRCDDTGCTFVNSQNTGQEGRFYFVSDFNGLPLASGTYFVDASAEQYELGQSPQFTAGDGDRIDMGDVGLTPFPLQFHDLQVCDAPSEGGICEFSVRVTNPGASGFSGKAWSVVGAFPTGSFLGLTAFQAGSPLNLRLAPDMSQTVHFRFRVPAAIPDGAYVCPQTFVGQNPDAYFTPLGIGSFFCLVKGPEGLLSSRAEARRAIIQMRLQRLRPK
jgi:5-hydroxyisourate hydrolase-like protein (transthyretin family)